MQIEVTKKTFKSHAKKQHAAMKLRCPDVKLSDIQESLAVAFGYKNLATMYAQFDTSIAPEIESSTPYYAQTTNLFVMTWINSEAFGFVPAMFPPGTNLDTISGAYSQYQYEFIESAVEIPDGLVFSAETVVLENYARVPRIDRYGLSDSQHYGSASKWVKDNLGFRVPKSGIDITLDDSGDDSSGADNLLIWLNDSDAEKVRAMFT